MNPKREYSDYLSDINEAINDIESFTRGWSFEQFIDDKKTCLAVVRSLEVIEIGRASCRERV